MIPPGPRHCGRRGVRGRIFYTFVPSVSSAPTLGPNALPHPNQFSPHTNIPHRHIHHTNQPHPTSHIPHATNLRHMSVTKLRPSWRRSAPTSFRPSRKDLYIRSLRRGFTGKRPPYGKTRGDQTLFLFGGSSKKLHGRIPPVWRRVAYEMVNCNPHPLSVFLKLGQRKAV